MENVSGLREPDIQPDQVLLPFDGAICGFRKIKFDNSPFFSRVGGKHFNEVLSDINKAIQKAYCAQNEHISSNPYACLTLTLRITMIVMVVSFMLLFFTFDNASEKLRIGGLHASVFVILPFSIFFLVYFVLTGFVVGRNQQFRDFSTIKRDIISSHLAGISSNFAAEGYAWDFLEVRDALRVKRERAKTTNGFENS